MVRAHSIAVSRLPLILAGALALGGCQMTQGTPMAGSGGAAAAVVAGPGQRVIERDIEAPNVFQVEEGGLWDGRPSLGGVWVAHPDVQDPERAMIRNPATGQEVIGALFRRERENPGPRFQISSEAANALGILPGAPTEIAVTALRLQRVELEIEPGPQPATAAEETLPLAPVVPVAAETAPAASQAEQPTVQPTGAPSGQVDIVEQERPRRGLFGLFRRREPDAAAAIAQTTLAPSEATAETAVAATSEVAQVAASSAAPTAAAPVSEEPRRRGGLFGLFRRTDPEPDPDTTMIALPGAADAAAAPLAATAAPAQPQGPRIDRPFVQIGIFSIEQNAINARAQMQGAGLNAEIRRGRVGENLFWRVVVGPAGSTSERARFLRRVRTMGFADAYAVVR